MAKIKHYEEQFTPWDALDVTFATRRGEVVRFAVNYRAKIQDQWHEALRVDTEHGRLHRHRFWLPLDEQVEWLPAPLILGTALREAIAEVQAKWPEYRARLEAARP